MALRYKTLENGEGIEMDEDGNPVVYYDGKDPEDEKEKKDPFGLNAIHLFGKIPALQKEAQTYREQRDAYKERAEQFGDLDPEDVRNKLSTIEGFDIDEAKKALETVSNLDQLDREKNVEIQQIKDEVKREAEVGWKKKLEDRETSHRRVLEDYENKLNRKDGALRSLMIKGAFDRSQFIKENTVIPPDMAYDTFGKYFKVEEDEGKVSVLAIHPSGNKSGEPIYSSSNPGDLAQPEEAIEILINEYPYKENILKTNSGGSGSGGNTSGDAAKRARQQEINNLPPHERLNALRNGS